ncbi:hypothetical protein [Paenibacillus sp. QZ-Y1]|uniref:hypothetical protein n=1 Tax=Paenibacillus sp. QZ-Y1 TaxID=3414511 RepID=UPI003F7B1CBC
MYTVRQLETLSSLSWWDLSCPPLKILFDDWKDVNGLSDDDIDKMMDILMEQ